MLIINGTFTNRESECFKARTPIRNAPANKSDERQMRIIQHTALHYPFAKLVGSPVSKVCPIIITTHLSNNRNNGFHQFLL